MATGKWQQKRLCLAQDQQFGISDKLSKNAGMPMVGICKRGPTGATGACTFPPSHKVPIARFNFRVYDLGGFSQYSVFTRYVLYEICMIHSNTSKPPQYCHIRHNTAEHVARADHQGCRICVSVSALLTGTFLFCQALFMRDPKWPKNDPK